MRTTAYWLYLLFVVSWFIHLTARLPVLGVVRFDLLLVAAIAGLQFMSSRNEDAAPPQGAALRTRTLITVLTVYCLVSIPFVEWPGSVVKTGFPNFVKATVFYWFTAGLVTTPKRLAGLVVVFMASQVFRVLEPLYLHVTTGYWGSFATMAGYAALNRLSGSPYDIINPNGLAFVMLTAMCFLHYVATMKASGTIAYVISLPPMLYALMLSGSRSGFLALMVIGGSLWLKSSRKVMLAAAMAVVVVVAVPYLSDDLVDRYMSIFSSNTKNSITAEDRTEGFMKDMAIAMRRPIFGHGLGTSLEANANFRNVAKPSHNLYSEAAEEVGFVGMFLLIGVIGSTVMAVRDSQLKLRASGSQNVLLLRVNDANQVWLIMNLLFSLASYGLSSYEWYLAAGLAAAVERCAAARTAEAVVEKRPAPLQPALAAYGINPEYRPRRIAG